MYSLRKSIDPGLLLTLALTLFLSLPLASNAGLPDGHDLQIHAYRASEMRRSWEHGLFFPSWAEGTYFGYGSPIFHFYARLTYMLTAMLQVVFGLGTLDALRCFLLLGLLTCSGGMYLFCKRRSGRLGAFIAGLVYVYSPYLMYTEAYARGAYPELLAFAIFPLLLWRVDALRDRATPRNFLLVCLLQVALINSHNLMAAVLTVIATAWVAFETMIQRFNREASQVDSASGFLALMALGLGIAAASTFWLPVLLEGDSVHLQNLKVPAYLDFRDNFVRIRELLAAPPLQDAGMSNGLRPIHQLGIAQWSLALLGGVSGLLLYVRGYRTRHPETLLAAVFYGLLAVALISLVAPESREVWDRIEPLHILQFPWRFLGPIAACLAIVASLNDLWLSRLQARYQVGTIAMISALPLVTAIPLLYVPNWQLTALDTSIAAYHQASELNPALLGTTATGEYLPRSTHSVPTSTESLLYDFADGHPIDRLNRKLFPPDAQAVLTGSSPQSNEWRIRSESSFVAEILLFYWLGWRAEVNGQTVAIQPSPHHGLITVALPAGESRLRVYLGSTPARDLAAAFSALAVVLACMMAWRLRGLRLTPRPYWTAAPLKPAQIFGILLASLIMVLCLLVSFGGGG